MKQFKVFFPTLAIVIFFYACTSSTSLSNYNYSYLYDDQPSIPRPEFEVFHLSENVSQLYFKLNSENILYSKNPQDSIFSARLHLKYKIYAWNNRKSILDSATVPIVDYGKNNENRILTGNLDMNVQLGQKYFLEIRIRDNNRDLTVLNYHTIDKSNNANRQYFLIEDTMGKVLIGNVLLNNSPYVMRKSPLLDFDKLIVQTSTEELPLAAPPFSETELYQPEINYDSSYSITFSGAETVLYPTASAIHHLFPEVREEDGFYLYHFSNSYPFISSPEDMVEPLRYISTQVEYNNLESAVNKKKEVDDFWLRIAGNEDRARKIMNEYYERVEKNNQYFTSYKEGWKTDRGMIYLIYGQPSTIYKTPTFESWIYGEESNILSMTFKFRKIENPMSDNDFVLMRNISMKPSWYREVDTWRQGRIN